MNRWVMIGAINMAIAVALGAFGTHALKEGFSTKELGWWMTAQQYQIWHALGLILVGVLVAKTEKNLDKIGWLFVAGTVLFSGSLYLMSLTGVLWLGAITPLGGASMIVGWILLALSFRSTA